MVGLKDILDAFKVKHETLFSKGSVLQVVYNDKLVMLKLDGATNSRINKGNIYTGGYWDYFLPLVYAYKNPRILLIGLGLGTTPYQLKKLFKGRFDLDIVEYDPKVVGLAKKYSPSKITGSIFVEDGFEYVKKSKKRYDVIMLDAYGSGARIPKQFYSEEFVRNAYRILNPEGILSINYAMHPYGMIKFWGYSRLLSEKFNAYCVKVNGYNDMQIVVCLKKVGKDALMNRIRKRIGRSKEERDLLKEYSSMKEV
jgi:spermidine synthase